MQYAVIKPSTSLTQLRHAVGPTNLSTVLAINQLERKPNVGQQIYNRETEAVQSGKDVSTDYKITTLSRASSDSDVFERLALMGDSGWRIYQTTDALPGTIKIPEAVTLPVSTDVYGNSTRVSDDIYNLTIQSLQDAPHYVDPKIFNSYSTTNLSSVVDTTSRDYTSLFQFFKIPWGNMSIYSSIANESKDFPVYPEEISDNAKANYITMPEIIYQYEPWQLYASSGPRAVSYTFSFHRDMWTGDHRDGKANELIRFCMANCYPEYNGSAVNTALTTLYMNGKILIRGVLTDVSVTWDGPLGLDNFYLCCKLTLSFVEVSPYPLDYWTMMRKPLIG